MVNLRVYWNGGGIWFHPRKPDVTDVAYQLNNWYHFLWLCGDHICEQHVHNLDVANWVMDGPPAKADGAGGRTPGNPSRPSGPPDVVGNIYDNFSIDFTYPNGVHMYSSCRHLPQTARSTSPSTWSAPRACATSAATTINGKRIVTRQQDRAAADPVRAGAHRPDRLHPRRQAGQRAEAGGREHADGDHGPHGRVHRQGRDLEADAGFEARHDPGTT